MGCRTTPPKTPRGWTRLARPYRRARLVAAGAALLCSCEFLGDLAEPVGPSEARFAGVVADSTFGNPLGGARVQVDGKQTTTDSLGRFSVEDVATGSAELRVSLAGYRPLVATTSIPLTGRTDTLRIERTNRAPVIRSFFFEPAQTNVRDDTVAFVYSVHDSSGGLDSVVLRLGTATAAVRTYAAGTYAVTDTMSVPVFGPGTLVPRLTVVGTRGDTATGTGGTLTMSGNSRPSFKLVRPAEFYFGRDCYVEVAASDADSDLQYQSVLWGDGSYDALYGLYALYWHAYRGARDTAYTARVTLVDRDGATRDTALRLLVTRLDPPRLDELLSITPGRILGPADSLVAIGVHVLSVKGYVKSVLWVINEGKPNQVFAPELFGPDSGKVQGTAGRWFERSFPTASLEASNIVRVVVTDGFDQESAKSGTFQILGKPPG